MLRSLPRTKIESRHTMSQVILILGDQLSLDNPALKYFNPAEDQLLMIEASEESTHVWSHKARIVYFLSAMRHFAHLLRQQFGEASLDYWALEQHSHASLASALIEAISRHSASQVVCQRPGDLRLSQALEAAAQQHNFRLVWTEDAHFLCRLTEFAQWMKGKKQLRMEFFYRWMRQRTGILMQGDEPEGGQWNYDSDNRQSIPKQGLGWIAPPKTFVPDAITQSVIERVEARFDTHPGKLDRFSYAVTREQALQALDDFIQHRLADFGQLQDAMWTDEPFLFHSLISAPLNCQLLHPKEVIDAALTAYQQGKAPLNSVEGFVRQILGWREFMRGIYAQTAEQLLQANHFNHQRPLPDWFWTGKTEMTCLSQVIGQTLATGYAHHIQRLMVIGLYATLAELHPQQVSDWFHAVYIDATDWVQRPNVIGMALYANGGHFTSKPYLASGAYIDKMSNYCQHCRFKPKEKLGTNACPITQLYWRFLIEHFDELSSNPRTSLMVTHVKKLSDGDKQRLLAQAESHLL